MTKKFHGQAHGLPLKKQFGQHFLRDEFVVERIVTSVELTPESNIFEIGCGDGFLTREILEKPLSRLWVFEIDQEWAQYVQETYADPRMTMYHENILDVDFSRFEPYKPWVLLSNLPYQVTFPILHKLRENRHLLKEAVVMVQEEVAQKIVKTSGRGYGFISLFFQHYFCIRLLEKVPPEAFYPPPKVNSRVVHLKPETTLDEIPNEEHFWQFIKRCFLSPRRTLKNNLLAYHYDITKIPDKILALRAQQLAKQDFLTIWEILINK
jgi:16S rRNA (adenine1518-N6/adenine1519-N6)-dimethyltransferase